MVAGPCTNCGNCNFYRKRKEDGVFICTNIENKDTEDYLFPVSRNHSCENHKNEDF